MLVFYDVNFKDGALLSFLILSGEATYIKALATHCTWAKATLSFTDLIGRSFTHALQMGSPDIAKLVSNALAPIILTRRASPC